METSEQMSEVRFEFGRNWLGFVQRELTDDRIAIARNHLLSFLKKDSLAGLDFLDIGCGSGIHSAAARSSGADPVYSFDFDPNSVTATDLVRTRAGAPSGWRVTRGDVLDEQFVRSLGKWRLVYSWGVLHHTGDVWRAINNASITVADGGLFYIALYSADVQPNQEFWLRIKREYNTASELKKRRMLWWYVWNFRLERKLGQLPELIKDIIRYRRKRGMSLFVDDRDWLGGWPMEFTYDADVIAFMTERGFTLENIKTGEANTEFLFRKGLAYETESQARV